MKFSPSTINDWLCRSKFATFDKASSIEKISKEITSEKVKQWPNKGLLSRGRLNVKCSIFNRICASDWAPTNHNSSITSALAKLIFQIGT